MLIQHSSINNNKQLHDWYRPCSNIWLKTILGTQSFHKLKEPLHQYFQLRNLQWCNNNQCKIILFCNSRHKINCPHSHNLHFLGCFSDLYQVCFDPKASHHLLPGCLLFFLRFLPLSFLLPLQIHRHLFLLTKCVKESRGKSVCFLAQVLSYLLLMLKLRDWAQLETWIHLLE